jgi:hypothetical protein
MYSPAGAKFAKAGNSLRVSSKNSKANRIETGETNSTIRFAMTPFTAFNFCRGCPERSCRNVTRDPSPARIRATVEPILKRLPYKSLMARP